MTALSAEIKTVLSSAIHPQHGLITGLFEQTSEHEAGDIHVAHATASRPSYYRGNKPSQALTIDSGAGAGFDRETAYWAAIGEVCERTSASIYWFDHMIAATGRDLGREAINMAALIPSSRPETCAYCPDSVRNWVPGRRLIDSHPVYIPAAICYLGYEATFSGEVVSQSDSTGLACGVSYDDACMRALCELIERDAFSSAWLLNRSPSRILHEDTSADYLCPPVIRALTGTRPAVRHYHLATSFGVHVVMGVAQGPNGHGVVSAAASPSIVRAIEKATTEALHGWRAAGAVFGQTSRLTADTLALPTDHFRFYLAPERFQIVTNFCDAGEPIRFTDLISATASPSLSDITIKMHEAGLDVASVDLTTPDIQSLGFTVVRVVAPGLQPLIFGSTCTQVSDQRRLNQWRGTWSLPDAGLNPHPHPFP